MKRFLISTAAVALMATSAVAADLPVYEPAPEVAPVPVAWSWSGFYVGLNGGYGWGDTDVDFDFTDGPAGGTTFFDCVAAGACVSGIGYDTEGFLIGGHAGYNWQAGWVVFGLEADIDYSDMEGDGGVALTNAGTAFAPFATAASTEYDFFGTFRGRLGAGFDRFLVYGTGGLAYAGVENSVAFGFPDFPATATEQIFAGSSDDVEVGWTAGGGVEFAVTDNVTLGAEALYYDLGDSEVDLDPTNAGFAAVLDANDADMSASFENTGVIARGRLSVKFNSLFGG